MKFDINFKVEFNPYKGIACGIAFEDGIVILLPFFAIEIH